MKVVMSELTLRWLQLLDARLHPKHVLCGLPTLEELRVLAFSGQITRQLEGKRDARPLIECFSRMKRLWSFAFGFSLTNRDKKMELRCNILLCLCYCKRIEVMLAQFQ